MRTTSTAMTTTRIYSFWGTTMRSAKHIEFFRSSPMPDRHYTCSSSLSSTCSKPSSAALSCRCLSKAATLSRSSDNPSRSSDIKLGNKGISWVARTAWAVSSPCPPPPCSPPATVAALAPALLELACGAGPGAGEGATMPAAAAADAGAQVSFKYSSCT